MSLADLVKMHLYWRDVTLEVLEEEAERLDSDPDALELAMVAARMGSDSALVRVAKVFDNHRNELQSQLEEEQARLTHQALHDALTGLPNRVLFLERLAQSVEAAARRSIHSAVLFIDIDRFKSVNDIAGHAAGDQLLDRAWPGGCATCCAPATPWPASAATSSSCLCENLYDVQKEAVAIAERICATVVQPFSAAGIELFTSASIGIAFVRPGDDPHVLVARADSAMYMAKQRGRSRCEIYHPDFDERDHPPGRAHQRPAPCGRARRAGAALPAGEGPRLRGRGRHGGPGALAAPDPWASWPRPSSSPWPRRPASSSTSAAGS